MNPQQSTTLYFSDILRSDEKYKEAFARIQAILDRHQVKYRFLEKTKDIWCRDYMPIQKADGKLLQFRYHSSYLQGFRHLQSNPKEVLEANGFEAEFSDIIFDGGNLVRGKTRGIMTTRTFEENPDWEPKKLLAEMGGLLDLRIHLIPGLKRSEDMTGHADGYLRFIDEDRLLVNELEKEYDYYRRGFHKMIRETGLQYSEMPWFLHREKRHPHSAIGIYVNYLEIGNLILFPVFEVDGNKDQEALEVITAAFPDRVIEPVNINEIAREGGLVNCVSWEVIRSTLV